jgi:hypothetical protein
MPVLLDQSMLLVDHQVLEVLVPSTWLVDLVLAGLVVMPFFRVAFLLPLRVALFPSSPVLVNRTVDQFRLTLALCQAATVVPFR